jgi:hypothetical protein
MKINTKQYAVWTGLLLCTAVGAYAVPVTFQVDMGYQITLGQFNTDGTDHVEVQSGFNWSSGWGGNQLTNVPSTTLYQNTFDITNPAPATVVEYKLHTWGTHSSWENLTWYPNNNRRFTLASSAQNIPLAYFSDAWPGTEPAGEVKFQVDMSAQIGAGYFKPEAGDLIQAMGHFNNGWNGYVLTNDPGASNPYLYSGSYVETIRAPGTRIDYKFAMNAGGLGTLQYEGIVGYPLGNRGFVLTQPSPQVLPAVFFADTSGFPIKAGVYFQVDMSSQILIGNFNPASDLASVRGDAMGWGNPPGSGMQLFEDASRPGIYTNTWLMTNQLTGAAFTYKNTYFHTSPASTIWEDGDNKSVSFVGNEPTNSAGYHMITVGPTLFNNFLANTNDYLPADTLVTFSVSMTNAQSYTGYTPVTVFDKSMGVVVNGNWVPWWNWTASAPAGLSLTNGTGGDWIYSQTVLIPKGKPVQLVYKYGIDDTLGVNSQNNEAPDGSDRVRYIRQTGSYSFPLDTFGTQTVEASSFGNLTVAPPSEGRVVVSWLGRPGVFLQTAADLKTGTTWVTHSETAANGSPSGIYSTNYPTTAGATFFRLVKP